MSETRCEMLKRPMTEHEARWFVHTQTEWRETGNCPHLALRLYAEDKGPWHGCLVCGEAVA